MATPSDGRFTSDHKLSPADFAALATARGLKPVTARKIGFVAATPAAQRHVVVSHWNGKETTNTAEPGDLIVINLGPDRRVLRDRDGNLNIYVIRADRFPQLYEATGTSNDLGPIFKAKATVEALALPGGFDILAPWGARQTAPSGYLILNGTEVYGNNAETFEATYEVV